MFQHFFIPDLGNIATGLHLLNTYTESHNKTQQYTTITKHNTTHFQTQHKKGHTRVSNSCIWVSEIFHPFQETENMYLLLIHLLQHNTTRLAKPFVLYCVVSCCVGFVLCCVVFVLCCVVFVLCCIGYVLGCVGYVLWFVVLCWVGWGMCSIGEEK